MATVTDIKYIVRDPEVYGGKPCITGHRIAVHDIAVAHTLHGFTPEQITSEVFPSLSLAQVYAALLYYEEHKDEIDREIAEDSADITSRAAADTSPLALKIRAAMDKPRGEVGQ